MVLQENITRARLGGTELLELMRDYCCLVLTIFTDLGKGIAREPSNLFLALGLQWRPRQRQWQRDVMLCWLS